MTESQSEFDKFLAEFKFEPITFRTTPNKNFPKSMFDISKIYNDIDYNDYERYETHMYEPISTLQKSVGEPLEWIDYLEKSADSNDLMEMMLNFTAFAVGIHSVAVPGRVYKSVPSVVGETYEFIDMERKVLCIGEDLCDEPITHCGHYESEKWVMFSQIQRIISEKEKIIEVIQKDKFKFKIKKSGIEFTADRPNLYIYYKDVLKPWTEYKGFQTIKHTKSKARVELIYTGCDNYSKEDSIEGKVFDSNNTFCASITGNYLTKLFYKLLDSSKKYEIADYQTHNIFPDYFSFTDFTLKLNDPVYKIICPTDSRLREDIILMEEGNIIAAFKTTEIVKIKFMKEGEKRTPPGSQYLPRWFKKIVNSDDGDICYEYDQKYWLTKIADNFKL